MLKKQISNKNAILSCAKGKCLVFCFLFLFKNIVENWSDLVNNTIVCIDVIYAICFDLICASILYLNVEDALVLRTQTTAYILCGILLNSRKE